MMLFPTDVPGGDWAMFDAAGFRHPVTGVVFRDGVYKRGVPLGGLGTGFISLQTNGTLDYYSTIFNAFLERHMGYEGPHGWDGMGFPALRDHFPSLELPFLGLHVDGVAHVLTLQDVPCDPDDRQPFKTAKQIHYWGHYPVADLEYEIDAPVSISLRAWSPFLPGCTEDSNVPGAVFGVTVTNESDEPKEMSLGFSFHGPRHEELASAIYGKAEAIEQQPTYWRQRIKGASHPVTGVPYHFQGVDMKTNWGWGHFPFGYALGVIDAWNVRVGGELVGKGWARMAEKLADVGREEVLPYTSATDAGASVVADICLGPGEIRTISFILAWHAPCWYSLGSARETCGSRAIQNEYLHKYCQRFDDATATANHLVQHRESYLQRILSWQEAIYSEERLPGWLQDSLINVLSVLPQQSFWAKSPDLDHWWGDEGMFVVNESLLTCPATSCIANDQFGEWPLNTLFPELALRKLDAFRRYQKPSGQVPSSLGPATEPDTPRYDQMPPIDGQVYVHMVDRYWQATGDDSVLDRYYESVKAQVEWLRTVDEDGDGIPDVHGSDQYYDNWPQMAGAAIHVSTYWLATLGVAVRMADKMGDVTFGNRCGGWMARARASMERKLWNETVGSYLLYHQPETGVKSDSILSDQLIGQYLAELHGLPPLFPEERIKRVLNTIWRTNALTADYGVRLAMRPDGTADDESAYSALQNPAYSLLTPAGLMMARGWPGSGLQLVRSTWANMIHQQSMAWDMPAHLKPDGTVAAGREYYHPTMLWTLPMAVLGQDIKAFCGPGGLADRVKRAAKGEGND